MDMLSKILLVCSISLSSVLAEVDPPNYDFSLDKFNLFMPGKTLAEIEKTYPKKEFMLSRGSYKTYKFYVEHIRYRFPILVQFKEGVVTDFHARLPTYFLHDIFHQSLLNRYGKQDVYKNKKEQSIYIWKNKDNIRHYYVGACTITCFPIFYAARRIDKNNTGDYAPILQQLKTEESMLPEPSAVEN